MQRRTLLAGAGAVALASALPQGAAAANSLPMAAPVHVGTVGLRARNAEVLARWYAAAVGLRELSRDGDTIWMGAGRTPLLALRQQEGLALAAPSEAGLFHTAFLLPSRQDLACWIAMAVDRGVPVDGTADHLVSEAIYLTDPEGNGVEIYADRPQDSWTWIDGQVEMGTEAMDYAAIMGSLGLMPPVWNGAPAGTRVGHVHLKVGAAQSAARWWQDRMGFDAVRARASAVFLSTGHYHHHIAVNEWLSAGAGRRSPRRTGLDFVALARRTPAPPAVFEDDWGTTIRLT
ncbi:VOC family protein [Pseudooceanicola sp. CBS1P-1]|uniref:VOC family protein n=1 Tax=Pseudooceanicola albus TaxID=2692189 RepID=A0A6L7G7E2_9RHOB|nr:MULTISPECIES: VOC family protein [Pseudooceanicola]MBT9384403.1 VOC family protein [Pseudooceanicola endophyticus]MXN19859.1 VOC family protein [Pseudooceanicola albus]